MLCKKDFLELMKQEIQVPKYIKTNYHIVSYKNLEKYDLLAI